MALPRKFNQVGVECPECGSLRTGVSKAGLDSNGTRLRRRGCRQCGFHFNTIEIPMEFDFYNTDTMREPDRVRVARKSTDHFVLSYARGDARRTGGDKIISVNAKIIKGKPSDYCYRGLHKLVGNNLLLRKDGTRNCRACTRERENTYYTIHRDIINHKRRIANRRKRLDVNRTSDSGRITEQADSSISSPA